MGKAITWVAVPVQSMTADAIETFSSSLGGGGTVHETTAAEFGDTVEAIIEEPAVGTPLPFEDVSLDETPVSTQISPKSLQESATGVTPAGLGIANYGTVTIQTDTEGSELVSLYLDHHVAVLAASDIVPDMPTAYEQLGSEFERGNDTQILATGPSATADMGTLVHGVHGPDSVDIVILEDR